MVESDCKLTALVLKFGIDSERALFQWRVVTGIGHDRRLAAITAALDCIKEAPPKIDSIIGAYVLRRRRHM